jgi:hypothetical protein
MFSAAARYTMRTYPGRILNIVASKRITAQDTRYAWRELALGGCRTINVGAGGMLGLLASPYVEEVSSHIQRFISDNSQDTPVRPNRAA